MMSLSVESLLVIHAAILGIFLAIIAWLLKRRGLFRWDKAGFWAWSSLLLYFVLNPVFALLNNDLLIYQRNLLISGGSERVFWILIVALAGIIGFFFAYLSTRSSEVDWRLRNDQFSFPMILVVVFFSLFGIYSLLSQSANLVNTGREKIIEGGRFVGQVTGYENVGYVLLIVPILLMVFSRVRRLIILGWLASGLFILLALPSGWSRFILVSMLLALSIADTVRRKSAWPRLLFIILTIVFTVALQLHGHARVNLPNVSSDLVGTIRQMTFSNVTDAIGSSEVSMLGTWYLESYTVENYYGFSYGLQLVNYALTGWIPSSFFPDKYFLIDWLKGQVTLPDPGIEALLAGAKSSLIGSFYGEGGIIGVVFLSALWGFLSRKLDGMVTKHAPLLVRATGVAWMSVLWMVWGSADTWGFMIMGTLAIPALVLWVFSPKTHRTSAHSTQSLFVNK